MQSCKAKTVKLKAAEKRSRNGEVMDLRVLMS